MAVSYRRRYSMRVKLTEKRGPRCSLQTLLGGKLRDRLSDRVERTMARVSVLGVFDPVEALEHSCDLLRE